MGMRETQMQTLAAPSTIDPLVVAGVRMHLMDSQHLIASGQSKFAAIMLWSAFETAVRLSLTDLGQKTDDPIEISETPQGLSTQAVAYGVINPEDRAVLLHFLPIAHGNAEAIDVSLLQEVSRFTKRTLDEMEQPLKVAEGKDNDMTITSSQFIAFASSLGASAVLTSTGKPFTLLVQGNSIYVTPHSTGLKQRRFTVNNIVAGLAMYSQTGSLRPTDYSARIAHSSYFVGILQRYLNNHNTTVQGLTG